MQFRSDEQRKAVMARVRGRFRWRRGKMATVNLMAFGDEGTRQVGDIPDEATTMNALRHAYVYSQNKLRPRTDRRSSTVGDVIHMGGTPYLISSVGYLPLSEKEFRQYRKRKGGDRPGWQREKAVGAR